MANTLKFGNGEWYGKKDTILAYNDENSNYKPLPFDFSRASKATVINKAGLIETVGSGEPRIDYSDDVNGALKLEPQRTNLVTYSSDFSDAYWTKSGASVTSGFSSPDGTTKAFKLVEDNNISSHRVNFNSTISLGVVAKHTYSLFAKKGENNFIGILDLASVKGRWFNLNDGTIGEARANAPISSKIEELSNGWYKCSITVEATNSNGNMYVYTSSDGIDSNISYQGDGTSGIYIYGAQLEVGSYATSYIPTQGSAVTRLRDLSDTQNLSHVIGQTEGVIFYDAILVHKSTDASEDLFELSIDDGSNQNIFFINNYNNTLTVAMVNGGSYQFSNNSFNPTEGARYKLAFAYKQNDFALYINGNQIATDSSGTVPTMNQITFGNYYNNQINLSNSVKVNNLKLYNTRLSNSELAALTQE